MDTGMRVGVITGMGAVTIAEWAWAHTGFQNRNRNRSRNRSEYGRGGAVTGI